MGQVAESGAKPSCPWIPIEKMTQDAYQNYALNTAGMRYYSDYQQRYAKDIRQSDQVLLSMLARIAEPEKTYQLLDVGCSTGNLLKHIHNSFPDWQLSGMDMAPEVLEGCRQNPEFQDMTFHEGDLLYFDFPQQYDLITVSAVFFALNRQQVQSALQRLLAILKPGGSLLAFDFFIPFEQELSIIEASELHPEGLNLYMRPVSFYQQFLTEAGCDQVEIKPFEIPIDLAKPEDPSLTLTYTVKTEAANRLQFRGSLHQPWGFMAARKRAE